ncbi:ABC transporter substrate-binding protein [Brucella cytisi]|uniref:Sugar ABC transporter substrate-binding protein n=1 Tax=Brucella cytisi TaxID=407152 RepID=A0A1J6HM99_9HYPH|nr:sugar ABC transporter substrate-binding protein [Brucella cytisi]
MKVIKSILAGTVSLIGLTIAASAEEIVVATVNNGDMIIMQKLSKEFEKETGIKVRWVILEENSLREKLATDISMKAAQYDVISVNSHQTQLWGKMGWLMKLDDFGADYDYDDIIPATRSSVSVDGAMYAAPFYGESLITYYRKDLFEKAGLKMPEKPTFANIAEFAAKIDDKANGVYGICLRGKPGWGENTPLISTFVAAFGGEWFDMKWQPQLTAKPWQEALGWYLDLMNKYGPPGASSNGYNENRVLFSTGKCGMWIDATVTAGYLLNPKESTVSDKTGFAPYPVTEINPNAAGWSGAWSLAIPVNSTTHEEASKKFIQWATSKSYVQLVGEREGWLLAPPGTRTSTYKSPEYLKVAAPFADQVLHAIASVNPDKPSIHEVPYVGAGFIHIPEFQAIGTTVGQNLAAALAGSKKPEQALQESQDFVKRTMQRAGYYRN